MVTPALFGADSCAWTAPADHNNTMPKTAKTRIISHL
jgi:hypothetical protein